METLIFEIPISIYGLWKLLGNCVNGSYDEYLNENHI